MAKKLEVVTVFCAATDSPDPLINEQADQIGRILAERKIKLKYGGGTRGLMGRVSKACKDADGYVIGVMTPDIKAFEGYDPARYNEFYERPGFDERISELLDTDGIIQLSGAGDGSLHEMGVAIGLDKHNLLMPRYVIVNNHGFWDGFIMLRKRMYDDRHISAEIYKRMLVVDDADKAIPALEQALSNGNGKSEVVQLQRTV